MLKNIEELYEEQKIIDSKLSNIATEFLILARLTLIDFNDSERYDKAMNAYENSLRAKFDINVKNEYDDLVKQLNNKNNE